MRQIDKRITKLEQSGPDVVPQIRFIDHRIISPDGTWDGIIHRRTVPSNGQPMQEIGPDSPDWYPMDRKAPGDLGA